MIFNSVPFIIFFGIFFLLYWFVFPKDIKIQNLLILAGSYVFYIWWDWRFLSLLIFNSIITYFAGIYIGKDSNHKYKRLVYWLGILQGLLFLGFFKYFNFFIILLSISWHFLKLPPAFIL